MTQHEMTQHEMTQAQQSHRSLQLVYDADAFSRPDERADPLFYARERLVSHLDAVACQVVEDLIGTLIVEPDPRILDLMASWDSHLPPRLKPAEVVGLGLNEVELKKNPALSSFDLVDLNQTPRLPYDDGQFDAVLNVVSVDYLVQPFAVFREVARVLRPGGLFLVVFSHRLFPQKAVKIWQDSNEERRVLLVQDFFRDSGLFSEPDIHVVKGLPRPPDDRYADTGLPSDPILAIWADRLGGRRVARPRPMVDPARYTTRSASPKTAEPTPDRPLCPSCGEAMSRWRVPQTPFTEWDNEFMYICFNDACPYLVRGFSVMARQGNIGISYRMMYNPDRARYMPIPVPSLGSLRDSIMG